MPNHRVVVVGAGFGGLAVAKALRGQPVDVTVIDANNFHTFQPLLYQVASAGLNADDIGYAVRGIFRRQSNVSFRMARVVGADLNEGVVHLDDGASQPYDSLVIAAGAVTNTFGVVGVDEFAFPLKSIDEALALRVHVLGQFENVAVEPGMIDDGALTVVVCGGGPTGVEMSGAFMELFSKVLAKDFPEIDIGRTRVVLVEAGARLLQPFHPESSERALRTLTSRGVEVLLGVGVERVEAAAVHLSDGTRIAARTTVWAAGVSASPLAGELGLEHTSGGRIVVDRDFNVRGHARVFAIGDIAASLGDDGVLLPQVAQPAIQGGRHVARQIVDRLAGRQTRPFSYRDKGSMATIGRHDAIAEFPGGRRESGWRLYGPIGWMAWLGLHIVYLIGFRNRANVVVNWAWNYVTYDRGSRLLSERAHRSRPTSNQSARQSLASPSITGNEMSMRSNTTDPPVWGRE